MTACNRLAESHSDRLRLVAVGARRLQLAAIFAEDGTPLAEASLTWLDSRTIEIRAIRVGKGRLMHYFFHRGSRSVRLKDAGCDVTGALRTHWAGHERRWELAVFRQTPDPAAHPDDHEVKAAGAIS